MGQSSKTKGELGTDDKNDDGKKRYSRVKGEDYSTGAAADQKYPKGYENPFSKGSKWTWIKN